MANAATLAGHVEIADRANYRRLLGRPPICRVGRSVRRRLFVVVKDAMPFAVIQANHAKCYGLNRVGMRRRGYSKKSSKTASRFSSAFCRRNEHDAGGLKKLNGKSKIVRKSICSFEFIESSNRGVVK
jgi:UDP-N-acetylglucosamine acyltransferase